MKINPLAKVAKTSIVVTPIFMSSSGTPEAWPFVLSSSRTRRIEDPTSVSKVLLLLIVPCSILRINVLILLILRYGGAF